MKAWIVAAMLTGVAGCHRNDVPGAVGQNGDATRFGSATDISTNGEMPTNRLNEADVGIGGPAQRQAGNYESAPAAAQRSDRELENKIKVALTTGSTGTTGTIAKDQLTEINVRVHHGNVTLTGPAASEGEKETIGKQVAGFEGVKSVDNQLVVGARTVTDTPLNPLVPRTGQAQ